MIQNKSHFLYKKSPINFLYKHRTYVEKQQYYSFYLFYFYFISTANVSEPSSMVIKQLGNSDWTKDKMIN